MTEYDYSPEAYEKYIANQTRVSNWVTDQSGRFKQYSNPFVGRSTSVPHSYSSHHSSRHGGRSSQPSSSSTSPVRERAYRPEPHRSFTAPVEGAYRSTSHGSRSQSSTSPTYRTQASSPTSHSTHTAHNYDPYKPKVKYQQYAYDSSAKQIVLPPPRHGERYIIVPPEGRELVVLVSRATIRPAPLLIGMSHAEQ